MYYPRRRAIPVQKDVCTMKGPNSGINISTPTFSSCCSSSDTDTSDPDIDHGSNAKTHLADLEDVDGIRLETALQEDVHVASSEVTFQDLSGEVKHTSDNDSKDTVGDEDFLLWV